MSLRAGGGVHLPTLALATTWGDAEVKARLLTNTMFHPEVRDAGWPPVAPRKVAG